MKQSEDVIEIAKRYKTVEDFKKILEGTLQMMNLAPYFREAEKEKGNTIISVSILKERQKKLRNILKNAKIRTIDQLTDYTATQLRQIRGLGDISYGAIQQFIQQSGLTLWGAEKKKQIIAQICHNNIADQSISLEELHEYLEEYQVKLDDDTFVTPSICLALEKIKDSYGNQVYSLEDVLRACKCKGKFQIEIGEKRTQILIEFLKKYGIEIPEDNEQTIKSDAPIQSLNFPNTVNRSFLGSQRKEDRIETIGELKKHAITKQRILSLITGRNATEERQRISEQLDMLEGEGFLYSERGLMQVPDFYSPKKYLVKGKLTETSDNNVNEAAKKINKEITKFTEGGWKVSDKQRIELILLYIQKYLTQNDSDKREEFLSNAEDILALRTVTGDIEYCTAFTALAKRFRIPTMQILTINGLKAEKSFSQNDDSSNLGHAFVAVYLQNEKKEGDWYIVDPSKPITQLAQEQQQRMFPIKKLYPNMYGNRMIEYPYYAYAYANDLTEVEWQKFRIDSKEHFRQIQEVAWEQIPVEEKAIFQPIEKSERET